MRTSLIAALVLTVACAEPQPESSPSSVPIDSVSAVPTATEVAPAPAHGDSVISTRTVIFMHATSADFDSLRTRYGEDDFATIADDAMWYRATAHEYLEQRRLPVQQIDGKRSFTFRVQGAARSYDFSQEKLLDVIVLYEPDREPRMIAPVDVHVAAEYFGLAPEGARP